MMNNEHNTVFIIVMKSEWLNCLKITLVTSVLSRINLISEGERFIPKKNVYRHTPVLHTYYNTACNIIIPLRLINSQ